MDSYRVLQEKPIARLPDATFFTAEIAEYAEKERGDTLPIIFAAWPGAFLRSIP